MKHELEGSSAPQTKAAALGFIDEFSKFQDRLKTQFQRQEDRMNMIEQKMQTRVSRPQLGAEDRDAPHKQALNDYLRTGDDDGLRGVSLEGKSLNTAVSAEGGYLVDPVTADHVKSHLFATTSIRSIANVVAVDATAYDVLVDHSDLESGWASETGTVSETGTPSIERISIALHELSALPKASQRLLDDAAFDIEGWLADRIADKFAREEAVAFVRGDGVDKPKGFLTYPIVEDNSWSWGNIGYTATGADGDFASSDPADAIVDLVYALEARYRARASFVMNSKTAGAVRKMKDADGRFLWTDSMSAGEPARLMGYPVLIAEEMPDISTDETAIAFGDFSSGYTIAERPDLRVLRDPFSAKPHVLFYATKRIGGDVTDFAAIKLLKFGLA